MKEYILLIAQHSNEIAHTLELVLSGEIEEIEYKSKDTSTSAGGALQKSVPKPKDIYVEENKNFVAGLNQRQLELKDIYDEIRLGKNG